MNQVLSGIKVLEVAQLVAGPYCTKLLADLGADVIKVEPLAGDEARKMGPFFHDVPDPETSGLFLYNNTSKSGITLNLETSKGRKILKELLKNVDVLVEDFSPKPAMELGLNYNVLKKLNPGLVMVSITPFGQTGPYRDYKAYPLNTFHSGGEGYLLPGGPSWFTDMDRPPVQIGGLHGEYTCGLAAAGVLMAALYWRGLTGSGQHLDVSKQEVLLSLSGTELTKYVNEDFVETRSSRAYNVGGTVQCKDGYVEILPPEEYMWHNLVKFMGDPEWAHEPRFKDRHIRVQHSDEINAYIMEWAMKLTKDELYHGGQAAGVPIGKVATLEEVVNSPQEKSRGLFVEIEHPVAGKLKCPSVPYRSSKKPWAVFRPAPLLGQHNREVYCGRLGYKEEDLVKLRQAGVI